MNERIKQLARRAGFDVERMEINHANGNPSMAEQFAELIVRECMHECLRMQLGNQYTPEEMLFQTKYRKIIKEHFGVEE